MYMSSIILNMTDIVLKYFACVQDLFADFKNQFISVWISIPKQVVGFCQNADFTCL